MPHKDPAAAKASKRAYYLAHKEQWAKSAAKRKARLREESLAKKQAALLLPKETVTRACADCGVDITDTYVPKYGLHCKACVAVYQKAYRLANAKRISESKKQWKIANKAHVEAKDRAYALANPDKKAAARKKWVLENPGKDTASKAKNAQTRKKRIPTWLSDDDLWIIEQAYELAALRTKLFGFAWHVDHIIPLKGRKVSGLHVPNNIQVIPWIDNLRKSNRMEVA